MRRVLSLDYIIERPTLGWLPTEDEKVQRFEALGIDRAVLPCRYGTSEKAQPRYFAHKLPIAVDEKAATFVYVASGQTTASELRTWGAEHAPLWAALRALSFAMHVVAVGAGTDAASRRKQPSADGNRTGTYKARRRRRHRQNRPAPTPRYSRNTTYFSKPLDAATSDISVITTKACGWSDRAGTTSGRRPTACMRSRTGRRGSS